MEHYIRSQESGNLIPQLMTKLTPRITQRKQNSDQKNNGMIQKKPKNNQ